MEPCGPITGQQAARHGQLVPMTMSNTTAEQLLQEIALELAFAITGGKQSISTMQRVLGEFQQVCQSNQKASLTKAIDDLKASLLTIEQEEVGLEDGGLDRLQKQYLEIEKAFYAEQHIEATASSPWAKEAESSQDKEKEHEPTLRIVVDSKDDLELLNEFCNEGRDLLTQVEQGVLILEEQPSHRETLNQVFRAFHTFKGGAGFLALEPIKDLAHILESLLEAARQDSLEIDRQVINLILEGRDSLSHFVDEIERTIKKGEYSGPIVVPTIELMAKIRAILAGEQLKDEEAKTNPAGKPIQSEPKRPPIEKTKVTQNLIRAGTTSTTKITSTKRAKDRNTQKSENKEVCLTKQLAPSKNKPENLSHFVRIDTEKLDALIDLVGELVIAQSMVVEHPLLTQNQSANLPGYLRQLARISSDLQRNAMSLRMVPIRTTFQKMTRLVRDLGNNLNKDIVLVLKGEDTELDRNIVEALAEPLIHMLRNSIDHGIEQPEERISLGKPPQGKIQVEASHQGGGILIRIEDDGRGINPDNILEKAISKGLVESDFNGSTNEIINLIFEPGFSTAETITDVSGRGVGMDVVRGSISRLRGRIEFESTVGIGSTFRIYLPLTLAIIDGILVGVGAQRFILPTLAIHESFKPTPAMISTVKGKGQLVNLRGKLIPLLRLSLKLKLQNRLQDPSNGIILIIDSGGKQMGLLVDRLISKQEVVIKALGDSMHNHNLFSGAAIMGDGHVALILDPDALGRTESNRGTEA